MEVQVAQVNKATIKDVISIRSNDANSAVVVFKDAEAFNTAKKILSSAKMKFTAITRNTDVVFTTGNSIACNSMSIWNILKSFYLNSK